MTTGGVGRGGQLVWAMDGAHASAAGAMIDSVEMADLLGSMASLMDGIQAGTATAADKATAAEIKDKLAHMATAISTAPPVWAELPMVRADVFVSVLPNIAAGASLRETIPMAASQTGLRCQIAGTPFAKGAIRFAYHARIELSVGHWRSCVLKQFIVPKLRTRDLCIEQLETDNCALLLCSEWSKSLAQKSVLDEIDFAGSQLVEITTAVGEVVLYTMENKVAGDYTKWTSNDGSFADPSVPDLLRFSRWTHDFTKGYMMVTDLQGTRHSRGFSLTDPVILCRDLDRFGPTNFTHVQMSECLGAIEHALKAGSRAGGATAGPRPPTSSATPTARRMPGEVLRPITTTIIIDVQMPDALHKAALAGDVSLVGRLCASGADVELLDEHNQRPLLLAAYGGHLACVDTLLVSGAKVNADSPVPALWIAAQLGHESVIERLLEAGADVNRGRPANGETPLYSAADKGHTGSIMLLIKANADVNRPHNPRGDRVTPLYQAAFNGHADAVEALLQGGADETRTCGAGPPFRESAHKTALYIAQERLRDSRGMPAGATAWENATLAEARGRFAEAGKSDFPVDQYRRIVALLSRGGRWELTAPSRKHSGICRYSGGKAAFPGMTWTQLQDLKRTKFGGSEDALRKGLEHWYGPTADFSWSCCKASIWAAGCCKA